MKLPPYSDLASHWTLDPQVVFLNHGAFGACPSPVLAEQQRLRQQLEQEPLRFVMREWEPLLDHARHALGEFVGADAANLVFVPNATTGINSVLRSLTFGPGDELLTHSHIYNACRNALEFVAQRSGATVVVAPIPFPIEDPQQVVEAIVSHTSPRTKLALIDHITSPTALVFPLQALVNALSALGIPTLVDGAHAPGMVDLNLDALGATYYTGNCHKWMCAPKGSGFLYVQPDHQAAIRPLTISHGANATRGDRSRFHLEFDWTGTHDPTPYLCIPAVLAWMQEQIPGGWATTMACNRALALQARDLLCKTFGQTPPCPDEMIGAIAAMPLPSTFGGPNLSPLGVDALQDWLWETHHIEVPIIPWSASTPKLIRISAQRYNSLEQYHYLAEALCQWPQTKAKIPVKQG